MSISDLFNLYTVDCDFNEFLADIFDYVNYLSANNNHPLTPDESDTYNGLTYDQVLQVYRYTLSPR